MSINEATRFDWDRATAKTGLEPWMRAAEEEAEDVVNKPHHYNTGNLECIEAIQESMDKTEFKGYLKGNVMKYIWRYEYKNGVEDLRKARWYLERLIEEVAL